ncbi:MAG: short chain dehydrogenase, partial [Pseudomonadota bacterium]|nr:short chain dehydrogenase [Pseudomonadota bacterium]
MKVMILGAGGGIGLALLEAYAQAPETTKIFATHHRPVSDVSPLVNWLLLDLGDPDSVAALAAQVDDAIDRWICCTGILAYPDHGPEKSLRQLNAEKLQRDHMI